MKSEWIKVVHERQKWAKESIEAGNLYSATIAAGAAWADTAFLVTYLEQGNLSTGSMMLLMEKNWPSFGDYTDISYWLTNSENQASTIIRAVERFREFLRNKYPESCNNFSLSTIQDVLMGRKAKRLIRSKQFTNLSWQFAGEAFWLFLSTSEGRSIEEYLVSLPLPLQEDLEKLGFVALEVRHIERLCELSEELVSHATKKLLI
ncbi:hypothetical protein J2Z66_006096 [Paenibacillus eucommiae]|uniref:Uncharacterized protein n=2 Tax=Paenibacillus eucommiae TaxID=1355755 RepID=A0ABS4J3P1_9BACL|nr:hypothetical protein [Paenibacillus eucommiae]